MDRRLTAIPALRATEGWREVPIEPVDEPLVPVADVGPRVRDAPAGCARPTPMPSPGPPGPFRTG